MNTTLRDSALSQTPAEMQGTLGDGNLLTDSQRDAFEAEFGPPATGRARGGGTGQPEIGRGEASPRSGGKG